MKLGTLEAWIEIEGQRADQYDVALGDDGKTASCWIASQEGKKFSINWKDSAPVRATALAGYTSIDGNSNNGHIFFAGLATPSGSMASVSNKPTSPTTAKPFVFSVVDTTDDDAYLATTNTLSELGTIKIEIKRITLLGQVQRTFEPVKQTPKVHERSKKGGGHLTKLGDDIPVSESATIQQVSLLDQTPLFTFTFRYRPLDLLMANGIAPPPPAAPEPRASVKPEARFRSSSPSTSVDAQKIQELEDQLKTLRSKQRRESKGIVKKKATTSAVRPKVEPLSHRGVFNQGDIIDLT